MKVEVLSTSSSLISLCLQSISSGGYFNPRGQRALTPFLNISKVWKDILSFCFSSCQALSFLIKHSFRHSHTQRSISGLINEVVAHLPAFLPLAWNIPELHKALHNKSAASEVRGQRSPNHKDP